MIPALGNMLGQGVAAPPAPVTTINEDFPGAWLILGDPYAPASGPAGEADRLRWPDTSLCGNDVWQMHAAGSSPWNGGGHSALGTGAIPSTTTIDGHLVPSFNGVDDSFAGWLTGTPAGENWIPRSESAVGWSTTQIVVEAGITPPADCLDSFMLTSTGVGAYHYASTIASGYGHMIVGQRYTVQCYLHKAGGNGMYMLQVDNLPWYQIVNLNDGTMGPSAGTPETVHMEPVGGGWWRVWYEWTATPAGAGYTVYYPIHIWLIGNAGSITHVDATQVAVAGLSVTPARKPNVRTPYVRTTGAAVCNGAGFAAMTFVVVAACSGTGQRAIVDICDHNLSTNTGPRVGSDTTTLHTYGVRAAATFWEYARAPGALDCHVVVGDPVTATASIYRNGVLVASIGFSPHASPAYGVRIGRLFQDVWPWLGPIAFVGYWPEGKDAAWALAISNKLRAPAAFPSIAP